MSNANNIMAPQGAARTVFEQFRPADRQARSKTLGEAVEVDQALVETDQQPEPIPCRPLTSRFVQ